MSNINAQLGEIAGVVGNISPDVKTAAAYSTGWINAATFQTFMAIIQAGTLGTSATLDAKLEQASDGSGTGVKDITGKAITQMTEAGTDQSDDQATISVREGDLDIANGFDHFRLTVTVGTATSDAGASVIGLNPRTGLASENDASTVGEVVI